MQKYSSGYRNVAVMHNTVANNDTQILELTVATYHDTPASTDIEVNKVPSVSTRYYRGINTPLTQSSSIRRALFVGLRPDVEATLSSSLMGVAVARALARFFL